jgi:hypothetical protein
MWIEGKVVGKSSEKVFPSRIYPLELHGASVGAGSHCIKHVGFLCLSIMRLDHPSKYSLLPNITFIWWDIRVK